MCLFGFGRWRADGIIGKSGAWPKGFGWKVRCLAEKIRLESPALGRKDSVGKSGAWPKRFGWKYDKPTENIPFEIRKIMDISGIINLWGRT